MKRIIASLLFVFAFAGTACAEGLYWESKVTGGPQPGERLSKSYAMPKKFKTVEENGSVIMRLDKEVMWQVRDQDRKYTEMTFAEMEQMGRQSSAMMDKAMGDMEKQMASLPPEQRAMMKKMMGNATPPGGGGSDAPAEVRNTGEKETISGFACTKYIIDAGGQQTSVWATRDVKEFEGMRKDWEAFSARMMAMMPRGNKNLGAAFAKIDGFPIRTEMGQGLTTTVTKVEKRPIADSEFEVPAGYAREKNAMMEQMDGGAGRAKPPRR